MSRLTPEEISQGSVLIIDDEPDIARLLARILRRHGTQTVYEQTDARLAFDDFCRLQPDAVVLDLNMPGVDGFTLMRQFTQAAPGVPVLVLSGTDNPAVRVEAFRQGARDYVSKPFDLEMVNRVRNLVENRLLSLRLEDYNRKLESEVDERTRQLENSRLEVVRRLGMAAEYRDDDTGTHIMRIGHFSRLLGEAIGYPELERLQFASTMHDVGKIGIPDAILLKPGKLEPEEFAVMKTHTEIGGRLLSGGEYTMLQLAETIAMTHHEKWDGSGYPRGLAGADIPVEGRIVAVCDVYDALTSERPYKKAWTSQDAVAEIVKGAGRHFDPELVPLFVDLVPRFLEYRASL